ncbi:MAG: glycosyltransferase, partial [Chloroflexi bacterium]|nr:glycosyltransferase [Chloroflexota bacterium]
GSAAARNTGLWLAKGEFILFLDADDLMLPGKLRQQAAFLSLWPSLGYVHSGWRQIDENGRQLQIIQPWNETPELTLESWLQYKPVQLGAIMFRRLWLDRIGGLDPSLRQSHDVDLMLRLSLAGCPGDWIYKPTICYRQHSDSTMRRSAATQAQSVLAVLDKFFSRPDLPTEIQETETKTYYYSTLWLAWHLHVNGESEAAVPYLQQNMALAAQIKHLPAENIVVEWLLHFSNWDRVNGRDPHELQTMWPHFQQAAPSVQTWSEMERLLLWWQSERPNAVREAYAPYDLWRIFQSGLDWERGHPRLTAEIVLSWWALVWRPYMNQAYDAAVAGWAAFSDLRVDQLLVLFRFGLAAEPKAISTTFLSLLWHDAQTAGLLPDSDVDEIAFFDSFSNLRHPQISVIIPTFNGATYIVETIESVFAQTYTDFEIIVIDDGSTDGTAELLRPYRGRLRYIYQENRGVSAARNHGLALALGEYILFLDGDDILKPDKLARQASYLDGDNLLGAVHSGWRLVDAYGRPLRPITPWQQAPNLSLQEWLMWKPVFLGAVLFRCSWLERIDGFDTSLRQAEDTDFLLRLSLAGCPMVWLETMTVDYRQHGASVTQNVSRQAADMSKVLHNFFQNPALPTHIQQMEEDVRSYTLIWLVWQLHRAGNDPEEMIPFLQEVYEQGEHRPPAIAAQSWLVQLVGYAREEGLDLDDCRAFFPPIQQALEIDDREWAYLETMLNWWLGHWEMLHNGQLGDLVNVQEVVYGSLHLEQNGHIRSSVEWAEWWLKVWRYFLPHENCGAGHQMQWFMDKTTAEIIDLAQASILYKPDKFEAWQITVFWYRARDCGLIRPSDKDVATALYLTCFGQAAMGKQWRRARHALWRAIRSSFHAGALTTWRDFLRQGRNYLRDGRQVQTAQAE